MTLSSDAERSVTTAATSTSNSMAQSSERTLSSHAAEKRYLGMRVPTKHRPVEHTALESAHRRVPKTGTSHGDVRSSLLYVRQNNPALGWVGGAHLCSVGRPNKSADSLLHVGRRVLLRCHQTHALGDQFAVELQNVVRFDGEVFADDLPGAEGPASSTRGVTPRYKTA